MTRVDSRVITALGDTKAGTDSARMRNRPAAATAFDDARTKVYEALNEGTRYPVDAIPKDIREDLESDLRRYEEALEMLRLSRFTAAVYIGKVIVGDLVLITERWATSEAI